jgi:polyhydroxybutyrate depolymerase
MFHGLGGSAAQIRDWTQLDAEADARGFMVAYPEGLPGSDSDSAAQAWNAGVCCGEHDDVAFVAALIDHISESYFVDRNLVYATGLSMGGALSYRLACELSDRIAAIAPVSAGMLVQPFADCRPSRAVPLLHVQGTRDPLIPYAGGPDGLGQPIEWSPVADEVAFWRELQGCNVEAVNVYSQGDASCQRWAGCNSLSEVELCTIEDGGHTWPGLPPDALPPPLGKTSQDLNATEYILRFFERHPLL